jgi:RES domain-containing protein
VPQRLDRTLVCFRIGDPRGEFPIYDARGSTIFPGRWNDDNTPVIYASLTRELNRAVSRPMGWIDTVWPMIGATSLMGAGQGALTHLVYCHVV